MGHQELKENSSKDLVLVITGTITINSIFTKYDNAQLRRAEYIKWLKFYSNFSKIYFLENSGYDFSLDKDFCAIKNVIYCQHNKSNEYNKGKWYQEFEMIDAWINSIIEKPKSFIKITGRYLIKNIDKIIKECKENNELKIIIERSFIEKKIAKTDIFYVQTNFYINNIIGLYKECNDECGNYIEHVISNLLDKNNIAKVFKNYPLKFGISGSTGLSISNNFLAGIDKKAKDFFYYFNSDRRFF